MYDEGSGPWALGPLRPNIKKRGQIGTRSPRRVSLALLVSPGRYSVRAPPVLNPFFSFEKVEGPISDWSIQRSLPPVIRPLNPLSFVRSVSRSPRFLSVARHFARVCTPFPSVTWSSLAVAPRMFNYNGTSPSGGEVGVGSRGSGSLR